MTPWNYHSPVRILFGAGSRHRLPVELRQAPARTAWVVDPGIAHTDRLRRLLDECAATPDDVWSGVLPNPTLASVDDLAARLRATGAERIVAIGGGSALDTAKAAAGAAALGVPAEAFHTGRHGPEAALPVIAMPTTAGTGSEVTPVAVLTDPVRGVKAPIGSPALYPRLAIVDPEWTHSMPPAVTASTGIDALSHALEATWSIHHLPICDALAEAAAAMILEALPTAYRDGTNAEARTRMALGSLLAGMAFAQTRTAAVHACSFPLTQRFGLPHGVACGLTLEAFLRFNAEAIPDRLEAPARRLGYPSVDALATAIRDLKRSLGLPLTLRDAGIGADAVTTLADESVHPNLQNNPRPVTHNDLIDLYTRIAGTREAD